MTQKLISMTERELKRGDVIKDLIDGKINGTDASKQIDLSTRQIRRLKAIVKQHGVTGLIHGNRGKKSNRKLNNEILEKVQNHIREKYYYFGPKLASEKLDEIDKIKLGKETVRNIMSSMGIWKPKSKKQPKQRHVWRARKENYGEMEQFDGSYHIWFGDKESCLLLSVDDAEGKITHAEFGSNESVIAVFQFWQKYFIENGLPISIYLDKFSTYKVNHKNAVDNKDLITQFERAMNQVGITLITAHSPEAKGRIERMFQTLQDRLVKELRLAKITTIETANEFLEKYIPKFNAQFAVVPKRKNNLHKKLDEHIKIKLPQIFSIQNERKINNDYTIMFKNKYFQLDEQQPTTAYKRDAVIIEEHLNGEIKINLKGHYLNYSELPERPKKEIDINLIALTNRKPSTCWKPPINHPWRKYPLVIKRKIDIEKLIMDCRNI